MSSKSAPTYQICPITIINQCQWINDYQPYPPCFSSYCRSQTPCHAKNSRACNNHPICTKSRRVSTCSLPLTHPHHTTPHPCLVRFPDLTQLPRSGNGPFWRAHLTIQPRACPPPCALSPWQSARGRDASPIESPPPSNRRECVATVTMIVSITVAHGA